MDLPVCSVVPPQLLDALASSNDLRTQQSALGTLARSHHVRNRRKQHFHAKNQMPKFSLDQVSDHDHQVGEDARLHGIVPDQILQHVVGSTATDQADRDLAQRIMDIKQSLQNTASTNTSANTSTPAVKLNRQVYDMRHVVQRNGKDDQTFELLPGTIVRSEGSEAISDLAANQAYDNCGIVLSFFREVFSFALFDDPLAPIISSIHFENGYQNAQWIGAPVRQMIYGDGGHDLCNFTACLDVIGHEMTVSSSPFLLFQLVRLTLRSMR